MSGQRRVVVLGAGVSGLTFSYYLNLFKKSVLAAKGAVFPQVTILEQSNVVGGWLKSHRDENTGAVFEYGPRSLRAQGNEARSSMALAEELGLSSQVISVNRKSSAGKNRLVYKDNRLYTLPMGILGVFRKQPLINNQSIMKILYKDYRTPASTEHKNQDESLHSFVSRRFGVEAADYMLDPLIRGIVAGDCRDTSIMAMMPRLKAAEDRFGSAMYFSKIQAPSNGVVKNSELCRKALDEKWVSFNFESGLGTIPKALHQAVLDQGTDVRTGTECVRLEKLPDSRYLVHTDSGTIEADVVVAAINSRILAKLIDPEYESISNELSSLPIHSVATATLEYPVESVAKTPQAFGHLIPSSEPEKNLGVIYESVAFPQHDREDKSTKRFTAMIGGAWFDEVLGSNPSISDVEDIAMRSVAKQLNIASEPVNIRANIIKDAIPQYPVGHPYRVASIDKQMQESGLPLILIGPSYDHPGAAHCIHEAKNRAKSLLDQWDTIDYQHTAVQSQAESS